MHQAVLVFTFLCDDEETPRSKEEMIADAVDNAASELESYVGLCIDYYDTEDAMCKSFITTKDGTTCQACRVKDFKEFPLGLPGDMIRGSYIDSFVLEKYGVEWDKVVEREMKEAAEQDAPTFQSWIAAVDVHL